MRDKSENEIWESYLKAAIVENSLKNKDNPSDEEIDSIDLPEHYDLKMRALIKKYYKQARIASAMRHGIKIASLILIIVGLSTAFLMQSDEIRSACKNVMQQVFEKYNQFEFKPDNHQNDTKKEIKLNYIPKGFHLVQAESSSIKSTSVYMNASDDFIKICCYIQNRTIQIDNEHYFISDIPINETVGKYFESQSESFDNYLLWHTKDGYYILSSSLNLNEMEKIAENIH